MSRFKIYLMGIATLIGFPAVGFALWWFIEDKFPLDLFVFESFLSWYVVAALFFGLIYAWLGIWFFKRPAFEGEWLRQRKLISQMRLSRLDCFFLSVCAGLGEELFFRAVLQHWLGIWITSVLFVAIHGYLNPKNIKLSLYGLLLVPFVLGLAYGYEIWGLGFAVAAHFSYDLVLFLYIRKEIHTSPSEPVVLEETKERGEEVFE